VGDIIIKSEHENLWLIPAGQSIGDNTEQLLNGRLEILFECLVNEFDYLIIDSPPVELVTDAFLLSEFCDITLFVIRHAYTPKTIAQRLEHTLQSKPLKNLAVVFNGVKSRGFIKKNYGYGYGYSNEKLYTEKYLQRKA
jgi:tyrosine-protein kinase Etk/Wzc